MDGTRLGGCFVSIRITNLSYLCRPPGPLWLSGAHEDKSCHQLIKTGCVRPDEAFGNSCSNRQCHKGSGRTRIPEPYNLLHLLIFLPQTFFLPEHLLQKPAVSSVMLVSAQVVLSMITNVASYCSGDLLSGRHILVLLFVILVPK